MQGSTGAGCDDADTLRVFRQRLFQCSIEQSFPVEARFHEKNVDLIYSRYRRHGDLSLDESFFPVLWDESGYRTPWLRELPDLG